MAKFTVDFPESFEKQLELLEHAGEEDVIKKMLSAGSKCICDEMKKQCQNHRQSGKMVESIKTTKTMKNEKGFFNVTRPTGKEVRGKHSVRNMEKLVYLHYGTSKQPATGIVTKIVNSAEQPAVNAMQRVFNEETKK